MEESQSSKDFHFGKYKVNKNVFTTLLTCTFSGISDNLWSGTVFVAYLKLINNGENTAVGFVEGAYGLSRLLTALPIGCLADHYPRSLIIKYGGAAMILTACAHVRILFYVGNDVPEDQSVIDHSFYLFLGVMIMWGAVGGIMNGPVQALYADSTPAGEHTIYYTYLFNVYTLSSLFGPVISVFLFYHWGDEWTVEKLKKIIIVGLSVEIIAAISMFFFDDKNALKESCDESTVGNIDGNSEEDTVGDDDSNYDEGEIINSEEAEIVQRRIWIPYVLFASDLVVAFGSGMTVKFFPVFFKDDCNLSPISVQIIYVVVPLFMVLFSTVASSLSKKIGRVQTILILKVMGISCFYAIIFKISYLRKTPLVLVPLYVLRTGFMNSTYPMQESILMDFVPKNQRARWKSLDSVAAFGWCGSAALGGILADKYDYPFTFLITAILQSIGCLSYLFLLPLVPSSEENLAQDRKILAEMKVSRSRGSLAEPLLSESHDSSLSEGLI